MGLPWQRVVGSRGRGLARISIHDPIGGAVQRNRAKRLLRETFRRNKHLVPTGVDIVLIARAPLVEAHAASQGHEQNERQQSH